MAIPNLRFLQKTPPVLTQQGVTHTVTGLADPTLGGGARGVLLSWASPELNHHSQAHTERSDLKYLGRKEKRKNCNFSCQLEVCFSRLGAVGQGWYQASGSFAEKRTAALPPFLSAGLWLHQLKIAVLITPVRRVSHGNRRGPLPLPSQGWD